MNHLSTENFLINAIKWLVFATLFTPLIISSSTLFPYVFGKSIAFQILVEIMIICYVWLLYFNRQRAGQFNYLPPSNFLSWSLMAFFAFFALSTAFGVDSSYSFWSKQERMEGLFNIFHFIAFAFILAGALKDKKSWLQILNVSLIVSFFICLHALGQAFGWFFTPYGNRLTATLGNAAFLATYLLFNIFFAFILFSQTKNIWLKFCYVFLSLFAIIILFLTYTRGAIFGMFAGFFIILIGYIFFSPSIEKNSPVKIPAKYSNNFINYYNNFLLWLSDKNRKKKIAGLLIFFIIASYGTIYTFRGTSFVRNNPLLYRLTEISFESGTGKTRVISWRIGLNAFLEKPILGWGPENYYVAFNKHIDPIFFSYSGETFDRAHNKFIDLLVMNGALGLLAYLAIFLSIFILLFYKRKEIFAPALILIALSGAYFIQNFILFDMPTSYLMFFLSLGLVLFLTKEDLIQTASDNKMAEKKQMARHMRSSAGINRIFSRKSFVYFVTLITIIFLWIGNFKPLLASQNCIMGQAVLGAQNKNDKTLKAAMGLYKKSIDYGTFTTPETKKTFSSFFLGIAQDPNYSPQQKIETLKFAAAQLEIGIEEMPLFFDYYLTLTDIYNQLSNVDKEYISKAETTIRKVTDELYPNVPYPHYKLIVNRLIAGDYNQAVQEGQKAVGINPQLSPGQWYLALSYYYSGNLEQAKTSAEKALELGYSYQGNLGSINFLTDLYARLKEYDSAIVYYQEALKIEPNNPDIQFGLAKLYKEVEQNDKAKELAQQAYQTIPEEKTKEVAEFLVSLDGFLATPPSGQ